MKVLFFGTNPQQFNGYSRVTYELAKQFAAKKTMIEFGIFGFQNANPCPNHRTDIPAGMFIYDAASNEKTRAGGFGFEEMIDVVSQFKPDICIVFNDPRIVISTLEKIRIVQKTMNFKIIVYADQVYVGQPREYIAYLNDCVDHVIAFTPFWEETIKDQGLTIPTSFLCHGFNKMSHYAVPKRIVRPYFGVGMDDFVVINMNRNTPRKRWDICLSAFAEVVSKKPNDPIKLAIATSLVGAWNLIDIYLTELKKFKVSPSVGLSHLVIIENPQALTDDVTNMLNNLADVGINTASGEGWGLCSSEAMGIGIPQIVPNVGGHKEFCSVDESIIVEPTMSLYIDASIDPVVRGEAQLCHPSAFADAILKYYCDRRLLAEHGAKAKSKMLTNYSWNDISNKLIETCRLVTRVGHSLYKIDEEEIFQLLA